MTKKDKLVKRFLETPSDFHHDEVVKILSYYDFHLVKTGKTSGSKVRFENAKGVPIMFHKPHPDSVMKYYQLKRIKQFLKL